MDDKGNGNSLLRSLATFLSRRFGQFQSRNSDVKVTVKTDKNDIPIGVDPTAGQHQDFGGRRQSIPVFEAFTGSYAFLPKRIQYQLGVGVNQLKYYTVDEMLEILSNTHPDLSFAIWNFLRIGNTGYDFAVFDLNDNPYPLGQKIVNKFIRDLSLPDRNEYVEYRGLDKVVNQLMLLVLIRGAAAMEMVLTDDLEDVAYLAPVDSRFITFVNKDGRLVPVQLGFMGAKELDIPTFFYEGLDAFVDDPFGRMPFAAALHTLIFQMEVLQDLKAVVHTMGYPRLDLKVVEEVLLKRMPVAIRQNDVLKQKWLNDQLNTIINMYSGLEPDAAFVHYDSVEVSSVSTGGGSTIDVEKLMHVIDSQITSSLKTLSTILGRRAQGQTETFAKVEIKLYMQGIEAFQRVVATILEQALTLLLNFKGKQGYVKMKFKPVEVRTELEQEQFRQIYYQNVAMLRDQGWISQDEAARIVVGHDAVANPVVIETKEKGAVLDEVTSEQDGKKEPSI